MASDVVEAFDGKALHDFLNQAARSEGFVLSGGVDLAAIEKDPAVGFSAHVAHYDKWLQAGRAGSMQYLVRGRDRRADPCQVFPAVKSVFSVAIPYPRRAAGAELAESGPRYARYLQGGDYHKILADKLERVLQLASQEAVARGGSPIGYKVCVDTSAVLERTWAALAGLGWIGKNTLLIHPQHGSYLFLAEVLIDRELHAEPRPLPDYCGNCTRCLSACPTGALLQAHELDARRCTSYLTLEQRGEWELAVEDRPKMGPWIAGCDICQEVCPFNGKPVRAELANPSLVVIDAVADASGLRDWVELLEEDDAAYRVRVAKSSLKRVKPAQFRRNLAAALSHAWLSADPVTRERLAHRTCAGVSARLESENDPQARQAFERCLTVITQTSV